MTSDDGAQRAPDLMTSSELFIASPRRVGNRAILEIAGELDLDSRALLVTKARSLLDDPPPPALLEIDATGIEFMDSSGLAALLQIREQAHLADVPFGVTKTSLHFQHIVDLAGLNEYLSVAP